MKQISKREQFYFEVGEAMAMGECRSFIDMETLKVDIHASEDYFTSNGEEDFAEEALEHPEKFLELEPLRSSQSFKVMEAFVETVKDKGLQGQLVQSLEGKKPFANFKIIIDNSSVRQDWFEFRNKAYAEIAKEWLEENASDELKEKIKSLPSVFIAE